MPLVAGKSSFKTFQARRMVLGGVLDEPDLQRDVDIEGRRTTIALRRHDGRKGGTR